MGRMIVRFIIEKDERVKADSLNNSEMVFRRKKIKEISHKRNGYGNY